MGARVSFDDCPLGAGASEYDQCPSGSQDGQDLAGRARGRGGSSPFGLQWSFAYVLGPDGRINAETLIKRASGRRVGTGTLVKVCLQQDDSTGTENMSEVRRSCQFSGATFDHRLRVAKPRCSAFKCMPCQEEGLRYPLLRKSS